MVVTAAEVQRVNRELQQCVATLQFEAAATLRDRLKALKAELAAGEAEVQRLEAGLQRHVEALEFEAAAQLRDRIKALRSSLGTASAPAGETTAQQDGRKLPEQTLEAGERGRPLPKSEHQKQEKEIRTVFVGRLPLTTKDTDLRQHFPAAVEVSLHPGSSYAYAFVVFNTVAEAEAAVAAGSLAIGGKTASLTLATVRDKQATVQRKREERRTVFLACLPPETSEAGLRQRFPTAEAARVQPGKQQATALVQFPTAKEAKSIAAQSSMEFAGKSVFVCMTGDSEAIKKHKEEARSRSVFLPTLPLTTSQTDLQQRFPTAESVRLFCGQFQATALVQFPTVEEAQGVAALTHIDLGGRSIPVRMDGDSEAIKKHKEEARSRSVFLPTLPLTTSQTDLQQRFPTAEAVRLFCGQFQATALVQFPTVEEAQGVAALTHIDLGGRSIPVRMDGRMESSEMDQIEQQGRTVHLSPLTPATTQAELVQSLPTAESIRIVCNGFQKFAFATFADAEEALAVAQQAEVVVAGQTVAVQIYDAARGQKRRRTETTLAAKRSKWSPIGA